MSDRGPQLDAARITQLLHELSDRLAQRQASAQLFIVGGAAMALAYDRARSTRDLDAAFQPSLIVRELAEKIGAENGLEEDWLNDAAKGFMPSTDADARTVLETDSLLVQVPSPEYLLAMKVHAGRTDKDIEDAVLLYRIAGYTNADQIIDLLERTYPPRVLLPRDQYIAADVAERAAKLDRTRHLTDSTISHRQAPSTAQPEPPRRHDPPTTHQGHTL
ncbi:DUF6036 family nucleotidyltransferase [Actinomyces respiraculi]|uniref:DUF6036 family nucleotidyltransferase n=1 Tax=Actinomyces respiraculi TaxID=2744574 RepID=UPI0018E0BAE7|nr:DUF6036 family nucleotidyltransferase [Actinomyces respiraculi]